jgi:hypothetical protein
MSYFGAVFGFYRLAPSLSRVHSRPTTPELDMRQRHLFLAGAAVTLTAACSPAPEAPSTAAQLSTAHATHAGMIRVANNGDLTPAQKQAIAQVKQVTQRFHDIAIATRPTAQGGGGYTVQFPAGCAASPDGAQGFHYLNPDLVDANVELLRPELVMYEPGPTGQMNLVGVDYIVPLSLSATPPTLLGQPFTALGPPLNVWALHIWGWRPNPGGMFALWNAKVSCANAQ